MYYVLYITSYDTCILLRMEIKQANINHALNIKTIPIKKTTIKNTNQTKLKILSLIFFWQILNFLIQLYFYHFISFRMKMSSENSFVKPVCNIFFFKYSFKTNSLQKLLSIKLPTSLSVYYTHANNKRKYREIL